jgi:hypothetical protein
MCRARGSPLPAIGPGACRWTPDDEVVWRFVRWSCKGCFSSGLARCGREGCGLATTTADLDPGERDSQRALS